MADTDSPGTVMPRPAVVLLPIRGTVQETEPAPAAHRCPRVRLSNGSRRRSGRRAGRSPPIRGTDGARRACESIRYDRRMPTASRSWGRPGTSGRPPPGSATALRFPWSRATSTFGPRLASFDGLTAAPRDTRRFPRHPVTPSSRGNRVPSRSAYRLSNSTLTPDLVEGVNRFFFAAPSIGVWSRMGHQDGIRPRPG